MEAIVSGKIEKIFDIKNGVSSAGKEWKIRQIVINDNDVLLCITLFNSDADVISQFGLNKPITLSCKITSKEYQGKYYTNITGSIIDNIKKDDDKRVVEEDLPF